MGLGKKRIGKVGVGRSLKEGFLHCGGQMLVMMSLRSPRSILHRPRRSPSTQSIPATECDGDGERPSGRYYSPTPPLTSCFVFNKSGRRHPRIPASLRTGIYIIQPLTKPGRALAVPPTDTHTHTQCVDLLAWCGGQSGVKHVP